MSIGLTPQAHRLLNYIDACMGVRDGVPPSYDEMRAHLDLRSKSGVARLLNQLEERGRIRRIRHRERAIEVVRPPRSIALPARLYQEVATSAARQNRSVESVVADAVRCWLDTD